MLGTVFAIEEFSVYDGPGIRTTVFLKGCHMRCQWCHNPESRRFEPEILKNPNGCLHCGRCTADEGKLSEKSILACPMKLIRLCGEAYEPQQLCEKILKNRRILACGGGVTFSGGEPLAQADFVSECCDIIGDRLHKALQTAGFCDGHSFEKLLAKVDYVLFDLKIIDNAMHKKYTGVGNDSILSNFETLCKSKKDFCVRIPLIPTVTDTQENIESICRIMQKQGVGYAELMPYNKMAGGKYAMLGKSYSPDFDDTVPCCTRQEIFKKYNIKTKIM